MKVVLSPGDTLTVELEDTDGQFQISYGPTALTVTSDLPDTSGRTGTIYEERYATPGELKEIAETAPADA